MSGNGERSHGLEGTVRFRKDAATEPDAAEVLDAVFAALRQKGYNPVNQLVGYLLSGDPAYITAHGEARSLISYVGRDELLTELVQRYFAQSDARERQS